MPRNAAPTRKRVVMLDAAGTELDVPEEIQRAALPQGRPSAGTGAMATLPTSMLWLDAEGVAQMLSVTAKQVRSRIAVRPCFPVAARTTPTGRPRWLASEVQEWMLAQQERNRR